ncbi:helix-turn-helix domain-containing protein [Escherichia coli]|nr:helix-turn-helix domain-containing protein [Escherichia coli]
MNNLMTTKQVADFCGVSVSTVLRWNSVNSKRKLTAVCSH